MATTPARVSGATTWAAAVLNRLGITPNTSNVFALHEWARSEGNDTGAHAKFNWLNSVGQAPGSSSFNTVGVQNYVSYTQGVAQTASLLKGSGWSGVLRALSLQPVATSQGGIKDTLKTGAVVTRNLTARIWTAIHNSPAAGNPTATRKLQTGRYPVALYTFNNGKGATAGGVTPTHAFGETSGGACAWKIGPTCVLSESAVRGLKGGLLVVAGGVLMFVGVALLAAYGFKRTGPLGQVTKAARKVGIGGPGALSGSERRSQAEADDLERRASPAQLRGEPTPSGVRLKAAEEPRRAGRDYAPFTEADQTLKRPGVERRPRSRQHRAGSRV